MTNTNGAFEFKVGQVVGAVSARYETGATRPPPRYTQDSLLDAMLNAYRFAKTDADREILKPVGLGTSRTRVPTITNFIERGFLVSKRRGKACELMPSEMAESVIAAIPAPLKDVALTAKWEIAFNMLESGKVTLSQVVERQYKFVDAMLDAARQQVGKVKVALPQQAPIRSGAAAGTAATR